MLAISQTSFTLNHNRVGWILQLEYVLTLVTIWDDILVSMSPL